MGYSKSMKPNYSDFWLWAVTEYPLHPEWEMVKQYIPSTYDTTQADEIMASVPSIPEMTVEQRNIVYDAYMQAKYPDE